MRLPYIIALLLTFSVNTSAQIRANFIEAANTLSSYEIEAYRNSIWENVPLPDGYTNDFEGIFSIEQEETFTAMIKNLEKRTGIEIALVTVDTIMVSADKFEEFADHLLNSWGVGRKTYEKGIVICISSQYKRITISRGAGTDKYLTDAYIRSLIAKSFIPSFKKHDYYGGTMNGLMALISSLMPTD